MTLQVHFLSNISTAKFLIRHLSTVAQSENTRMDSKNLATVIAPNLIRSTTGTLINDVKDLNNQCSLVDSLISKYDWFFELSNDDIRNMFEQFSFLTGGQKRPMIDKIIRSSNEKNPSEFLPKRQYYVGFYELSFRLTFKRNP